jgi:cytochrome c-type biogenesis protein CcmH/NrfG
VVAAATEVAPSAWEPSPQPPAAQPRATAGTASGVEAPPISDLVTGLETRLAAAPDDANGWALLAQTYAFLGDADGAERAIQHAVALGVDESALRARVQGATRESHPGNWIRATVGG